MTTGDKYLIGTSGYSFADWVGSFYPPGTRQGDMFARYGEHFAVVELNFTFYRMPAARTLARLAEACPPGFLFWVKANRDLTHKRDLSVSAAFVDGLGPLRSAGKLAGLLLQFPQSFHRTVENRRFLAAGVRELSDVPLAVEFRHRSWEHPSVLEGLRRCGVTLVVPDVPDVPGLYRPAPMLTTRTGYLRLHSRNAQHWYGGMTERYDYDYSDRELRGILADWSLLDDQADRVYAFFNNCHRGQAARNAEAFRRILGQI